MRGEEVSFIGNKIIFAFKCIVSFLVLHLSHPSSQVLYPRKCLECKHGQDLTKVMGVMVAHMADTFLLFLICVLSHIANIINIICNQETCN